MTNAPPYVLTGLMGWPVAHSRSPLIHQHWIAEQGLRGGYALLAVQPAKLSQALRALPALGFAGCNLTIPHKVEAMRLVDCVEPFAQTVGAINTVVVRPDGALAGSNTDGYGYMQSLRDAAPDWRADTGPVAVLGAGGAARSIVASLLQAGAPEVRVSNRSPGKALELAQQLGPQVQAVAWAERSEMLRDCSLLVNTTNQGMHGQPDLDIALDSLPLHAVVSDVVYVPLVTPLLHMATLRGHTTVNGLGMLLNQARPAFQGWFGVMPEITPSLLAAVQASL